MTSRNLPAEFDRIHTGLLKNFLGIPSNLGETFYSSTTNYPPYDIIQSEDESLIELRLALAGWSKDDLEVEVEKDQLKISGSKTKEVEGEEETTFLHKGISNKAFTRTFTLGAGVEVTDVKYIDGILTVFMEKVIPEEEKPRLIKIK
jgi:molecular chaperone IbpA